MSKIEQLIKELCPEGVEYVPLGYACKIFSGKNKQRANNGVYPVFGSTGIIAYCDEYKYDKTLILVARVGANAGFTHISYGRYDVSDNTLIIDVFENVILKYIYYVLINIKLNQYAKGGGQPLVTAGQIKEICVPLPPLPIQEEIVRILDTFTEAQANLEQELELRKKQYEYYRNQLLTFDENDPSVKWMKLNEVCEVVNGRAYKQQELLGEGKYRVLRVGNFFSNDSWYYSDLELEDKYYALKGDLLYAWSASFGPHIWDEEKVIYHYHIWKMICSDKLSKKFMFYWLQSSAMENQVSSSKHGATMAHLTKALMEQLVLPIPSQERQQEIVSILDKFESAIQTLEEELALRKKQYEYYREKLLTFN